MSGLTIRMLLIIACTSATLVGVNCARPLEDAELSTVVLGTLETQEILTRLSPSQMSPVQRTDSIFSRLSAYRRPPSPIQGYELGSDSERSDVHSAMVFDQKSGRVQRQQYTYTSVLHKNPAGPNPIGNEYGPANTIHSFKKYRSPPQG